MREKRIARIFLAGDKGCYRIMLLDPACLRKDTDCQGECASVVVEAAKERTAFLAAKRELHKWGYTRFAVHHRGGHSTYVRRLTVPE